MSGKSISVLKVGDELQAAIALRQALGEYDDPQLILDMIEGSTDLPEAIAAVYEEVLENEALVAGIKAKCDEMNQRRARLEKTVDDLRNIITMAMEKSGFETVKTPLATLTVRSTPPQPIIEDESAIPAAFWMPQDPKLDTAAVRAAIKDGQDIPGVTRSNGGISLTIRKA